MLETFVYNERIEIIDLTLISTLTL